MHIDELDEKLIQSLRTLFKDKKIIIKVSDILEESEKTNFPENVDSISNKKSKIVLNKQKLNEFVGKVKWPMDGMDYQSSIRSEWK